MVRLWVTKLSIKASLVTSEHEDGICYEGAIAMTRIRKPKHDLNGRADVTASDSRDCLARGLAVGVVCSVADVLLQQVGDVTCGEVRTGKLLQNRVHGCPFEIGLTAAMVLDPNMFGRCMDAKLPPAFERGKPRLDPWQLEFDLAQQTRPDDLEPLLGSTTCMSALGWARP